MKKITLISAMGLALGVVAAAPASAAVTLTFTDSGAATAIAGPCSAIAWTAGADYRMCNTTNAALGGGAPLQKNAINGGETWSFNNANQMSGTTGTPGNPGATTGSAATAAGSNPTMQQDAVFFGNPFNFLAPVAGSLAGNAYGAGVWVGGTPVNGATTAMHFNVLEAQWAGSYFPLGQAGGAGIDFVGTISNAVTTGNTTTFTYDLFANHTIAVSEDPTGAGFSGWTAQWHVQGTGVATSPVPVPAAAWLLGSGLLGLVGVARRSKKA